MAFPLLALLATAASAKGGADSDRAQQNLMYQQELKGKDDQIARSMFATRQLRQNEIESDRNEFLNQRKTGMAGIGMLSQMREDAMKRKRFGTLRNDLLRTIN